MLITILSIAAIVAGLVVLELGAERFTASLGALARRLRASESTVGLLTAGGEWEELVMVALALWRGHPALAVGNIVGSCLANLIGSMPLGLLGRCPLVLNRDARILGGVMFGVTLLATGTSSRSCWSFGAVGCGRRRRTMTTSSRRPAACCAWSG